MDQASYLANKFWALAGAPIAPVEPTQVISRLRFRETGSTELGAILVKPWDQRTKNTFDPPVGAVQRFTGPNRIDCRYISHGCIDEDRYMEAFLVGCAILGLTNEAGKLQFSVMPGKDEVYEPAHRFARNLLVPDLTLKSALEIVIEAEKLSQSFGVPEWVMALRISEVLGSITTH